MEHACSWSIENVNKLIEIQEAKSQNMKKIALALKEMSEAIRILGDNQRAFGKALGLEDIGSKDGA